MAAWYITGTSALPTHVGAFSARTLQDIAKKLARPTRMRTPRTHTAQASPDPWESALAHALLASGMTALAHLNGSLLRLRSLFNARQRRTLDETLKKNKLHCQGNSQGQTNGNTCHFVSLKRVASAETSMWHGHVAPAFPEESRHGPRGRGPRLCVGRCCSKDETSKPELRKRGARLAQARHSCRCPSDRWKLHASVESSTAHTRWRWTRWKWMWAFGRGVRMAGVAGHNHQFGWR